MAYGRSLELYFVDGRPDGMLTAEVFNWTGHILKAPRTQIGPALKREQARFTGVYVLLGDRDGEPLAYIGEAEDMSARIRDHDARRDWWSDLILVTTASNALNKAHVKYLEARLIETARKVSSRPLENATTPPRNSLSESGRANMEEFLDTLFLVLPAIGVDMFQSNQRPDAGPVAKTGPVAEFRLQTRRNGVDAVAVLDGSDFIVQKGSRVRRAWEGAGEHDFGYAELHRRLVAAGIIATDDMGGIMTENYAFNSPSAAAAVANGRPANGRIEWKHVDTGQTYKDWEQARLSDDGEDPA